MNYLMVNTLYESMGKLRDMWKVVFVFRVTSTQFELLHSSKSRFSQDIAIGGTVIL